MPTEKPTSNAAVTPAVPADNWDELLEAWQNVMISLLWNSTTPDDIKRLNDAILLARGAGHG